LIAPSVFSTVYLNVREYRRPKGQSKKDNPEELTTMVTGQINVREYRRPKGQSKKDNPEELTTMVPSVFGIL
jgi:NTP pyrophosphatase (non-canonical NTP hydrolase)